MVRISPSASATLFKIGHKKKGNDGKMWKVAMNKNGVKRWERADSAPKGPLFDNKHYSLTLMEKTAESPKELITASAKWAKIFTPIAKQLLPLGVILFTYPMGYYYADYAEDNLVDYIKKSKKITEFYEKFYDIDMTNFDYDELEKISYIYYLAVDEEVTELCLKHNITTKKLRTECYDIFENHVGDRLEWNKSTRSAICVTLPGHKKVKEVSFIQLFMSKIKKDVGRVKVIKKGTIRRDGTIVPTTIDISDVDQSELEKKLRSLGMSKSILKKNRGVIVTENEYFIIPHLKLLFVNFIEGMSAFTYNKLTEA